MAIKDKLTTEIAHTVGKLIFGEDYKLDDLSVYPNGFRITKTKTTPTKRYPNYPTVYITVEYEPFRIYKNDFGNVKEYQLLQVYTYLNKTMGVEMFLPTFVEEKLGSIK
jgi:hypothetical protein